jgi:predicted nucleic acid-binding protein
MTKTGKKVFLSADVFFAFIDRAHTKHEQASAYIRYFAQEEYFLFTDIVSINLVYEQIYKDISTSLAKDFMKTISLSTINIIFPDESDLKATYKTLQLSNSTELTFIKALISVLAEKRSIGQICTFEYLQPLFGISIFYLPL